MIPELPSISAKYTERLGEARHKKEMVFMNTNVLTRSGSAHSKKQGLDKLMVLE